MAKIIFIKNLSFNKESLIILFSEEDVAKKNTSKIKNKELQKNILEIIALHQFKGQKNEFFPIIFNKKIALIVGVGKENELSLTSLRRIIAKSILNPFLKRSRSVEILLHAQKEEIVCSSIEGGLLGTYVWRKHATEKKSSAHEKEISIIADKKPLYDKTIKICAGVNFARDLINDNADTITSVYLEKVIRQMIQQHKNIKITVLNKKQLKAKSLNLHLAVNQGSRKEPKLIIIKYIGNSKNKKYTAIIGKGITFDTGGLNLKPTGSMETMRYDMAGVGAVIGTLKNTIALQSKQNILFVCAIAENAIGSCAYKPGDVIKSYSGKTVEILNTDAEGRLVLADAISYIKKNYKPAQIIDIATLTGACAIALGNDYSALITPNEKLATQLLNAAQKTDDRIWRLPHYEELKDSVRSKIADIKNTGYPKGVGGTITAAEFLRQFAEETPWAHLDIASTAFVENDSRLYFNYGATGAGIRLLTYFIDNQE